MTVLPSFTPPGGLTELSDAGRAAWSARVRGFFTGLTGRFPQFFDPTATDAAAGQASQAVKWAAFPATVRNGATSETGRWLRADASRAVQDEYCEWSVERDGAGKLVAVTFTSETPEYYAQLLQSDENVLLELYEGFVGHPVALDTLRDVHGRYLAQNKWNVATKGPIAHLAQGSNSLHAAVQLAAEATVLRVDADGQPVTSQQQLVDCGGLGVSSRNSDPQIAAAINHLTAQGLDVSLANPPGLYLDGIVTAGMSTPDGADAAGFWTVERGDARHTLRARFAVPPAHGYAVGDIVLAGRQITFGAQLADRVRVRIEAVAQDGGHQPVAQPCVGA